MLAALLAAVGLPLTLLAVAAPAGAVGLPPASVSVRVEPGEVTADGKTTGWVYADIKDVANMPFNDSSGTVSITKRDANDATKTSDVALNGTTLTPDANGVWKVRYTASKTVGATLFTVTARNAASQEPYPSGTGTLTEKAGTVATVTLTLSPTHIKADGISTTTATVTLKDANNNGVPGRSGEISVGTSGDTVPSQTVTDLGDGRYTVSIKSSTSPGEEVILANAAGKTVSATLTEYGELDSIALSFDPTSTLVANGTSTTNAKAILKDAGGRGVANAQVSITRSSPVPAEPGGSVGAVANLGKGEYTAPITSSTKAQTEKYLVTVVGSAKTAEASLIVTPGAVHSIVLTLTPNSITADGLMKSNAVATVEDVNKNAIKGETVTITKAQGSDLTLSDPVNNGDGTYTSVITASKTAGNEVITAKTTSVVKSTTATLTETPGPATNVAVVMTPAEIVADGLATSKAVATVKDTNGNVVKNESVTFDVAEGNVTLVAEGTPKADGTYETTVKSSKDVGTNVIRATAAGSQATGTATLKEIAGPAHTVTLTLDPGEITADGVATSKATAKVDDAYGNPVLNEDVQIAKATGSDLTVGATTNNGDGTYLATITASKTAGTEVITATAKKANKSANKGLIEKAGPLSTLSLTLNPTSVRANGADTSTATVTAKDAHGNAVSSDEIAIVSDGNAQVGPVNPGANGTYTATITASTTPSVQNITATASPSGKTATQALTLYGDAQNITVTAVPAIVPADGTTTGILRAKVTDSAGNGVPNTSVTFGSDGDIKPASPGVNKGNGVYESAFTASRTAGVETITAISNGKPATTTITEYGPAATVSVALSPSTITADGVSTTTATATLKDVNGSPVLNDTVAFSSNGDVTVPPSTSTVNHGNGTYSTVITASKKAGKETITATSVRSTKTGTAELTEKAGPAAIVTVALDPASLTADGVSTSNVTATVTDVNKNNVTDETVTLSATGGATPVDGGATTNKGDGTYVGKVTSSTQAATSTVTATAAGTGAFGTAALTHTPGGPASITLGLSPTTIEANGTSTSTATATVRDAHGNLVKDAVVTMGRSGDTTISSVTNQNNGTYTAVITASNTAGAETITASAEGVATPATAVLTESAGAVDAVTVTLDPSTIVADGVSKTTATATVKDKHGNPVQNESISFTKDGVEVVADAVNNGDGTYTGEITSSTVAGPKQVAAIAGSTGQSATAVLTETPGALESMTLTLSPTSIVADGAATSTATAVLADANGNAIKDAAVAFTSSGDAVPGDVTNHGDGRYSSVVTASTTSGAETITANANNGAKTAVATLTETAGPLANLFLALNPTEVEVGSLTPATATATATDANNNPVTDAAVAMASSGDAAVSGVTNKGDGTYVSQITASTTAGTETITASVANTTTSAQAVLTEVPAALHAFTVELSPTSLVADGNATTTAKATLADAYGNAIKNETVTFAVTGGGAAPTATTNHGDGTYTSVVKATTAAGQRTVTAKAVNADQAEDAVLTQTAGPISKLTLVVAPNEVTAGSTSPVTATATVTDANDNPISNATVGMSTDGDAAVGAVANNNNGTYSANITPGRVAGVETITASITSANKTAQATLTEKVGPANTVTVTLAPSSLTANGVSTSTATATVKDAHGNLVPTETVAFKSSGDVKFGPVSNNNNGTYSSTITSSKTAGTETITATATQAGASGSAALTETLQTGGYWLVAADGGIFSYGQAKFQGSIGGKPLNQPVVGMTSTPTKDGYWFVASDGGIFAYNAPFHGSMGGKHLNKPVVGMASTMDGQGYWLVASDGGIFAFNAPFRGATGHMTLNKPIVGMTADPDGDGYWFVASDGGIFAFNAEFRGSLGSTPISAPIVGMKATPDGKGYWMVGSDGAVYPFGSAANFGSMAGRGLSDIVGISSTASGRGYWLTGRDGGVYAFGDAVQAGSPKASGFSLVSPVSGIEGF